MNYSLTLSFLHPLTEAQGKIHRTCCDAGKLPPSNYNNTHSKMMEARSTCIVKTAET